MSNSTSSLPVMEAFFTIQGEGFHSGKAAYFIRLGGCDVGCVWCDVKESWDALKHPNHEINDIVDGVLQSKTNFVVITGGEPAMYDLTELTNKLKSNGIYVAIETSGAYKLTGKIDWICLSPKKFKAPLPENLNLAQELKVIVYNKHDFTWAQEMKAKVANKQCVFYLQPEWDRQESMLPLIIDYVKLNNEWQVSLQTHKFMNIP